MSARRRRRSRRHAAPVATVPGLMDRGRLRDFSRPGLWLGWWVLGLVLCVALSLLPPPSLGAPAGSDKAGHLLAYFVLSAWAVLVFRAPRAQWTAAFGLVLLGVALEFAQALLTTTRQGDPRDALANTLGVVLGLLVALTPLATWLQRADAALAKR